MKALKFQNTVLAAIGQYCFKNQLYCSQRTGSYAFHLLISRVGCDVPNKYILAIMILDDYCTLTFRQDSDPFLRSSDVNEILTYIENAIILDELTNVEM